MYNQVFLIGRLTADPEMSTTENNKKVLTVNLAVQRNYKNSDGIYETDFVRCVLWEKVAARTTEFCKKGDLIAVRGQVRTHSYVGENEETKYVTEILVERVSFLSTKPKEKVTEEEKKTKK